MKKLFALITSVAITMGTTMSMTGCTVTAATIQADGQAVANALLAVAKIEATADPALAADITTAADGLLAATSTWTNTTPVAVINAAAAAAEAVLARIPATALVADLIPVAVAALDVLLANIPGASATTPSISAHVAVAPNPYRGKVVIKHRFLRSQEGDIKAAWNAVAKSHPGLESAVIK